MPWVIFTQTLKKNWGKTLGWGLGLGFLCWMTLIFIPDMDALKKYQDLMSTMPVGLMQAFGIDTTQELSPDVFIGSFLFGQFLLYMAVYAVLAGLDISVNEEDAGIMDVVLALPIARWRIITERLLAFAVNTLAIALMVFAGLWLGTRMVTISFNLGRLLETSLNIIPPTLAMIVLTAFFGTLLRRKGTVVALVSVIILASYFLDTLGQAVSDSFLSMLRYASFFTYANLGETATKGINLGDTVVLVILIIALTSGALFFWQRRDIGL